MSKKGGNKKDTRIVILACIISAIAVVCIVFGKGIMSTLLTLVITVAILLFLFSKLDKYEKR